MNWQCGIGMNAAREKVRVARALGNLPKISEAFRSGRVSHSKVRAMTRVATSDNEDYLLMIAEHGTAHHVETLVRGYRRAKRLNDPGLSNQQHETRSFEYHWDDDGSLVFKGRLSAEVGAMLMQALSKALDRADEESDVTAETSKRICCDTSVSRIVAGKDGEPLSIGRKSRVIPPAMRRSLQSRDRQCRFPGCTHQHFIDSHHIHHWSEGGETGLDNLVLLCRHHHRLVHEGGFGCERDGAGNVIFTDPAGMKIETSGSTNRRYRGNVVPHLGEQLEDRYIDAHSVVSRWDGETMDRDLAVGMLVELDEPLFREERA